MVILAALLAGAAPPAVTVQDIVETRDVSGVSISPDGRWIAYRVGQPSIDRNDVDLGWYVVGADGGAVRRVADGGDARFDFAGVIEESAPLWDADSRGFHFIAARDGVVGLWSWREGEVATLTAADAADILDARASEDGRAIVLRVGAPREAIARAQRKAYDEGLLVEASVDLMQPIAGGALVDGERVMQRLKGPWFERARLLSEWPGTEKNVPLPRPAAPASAGHSLPGPEWHRAIAPGGAAAEIVSSEGTTGVRLTRRDGKISICTAGACGSPRLRRIAWRPSSDELLLFEAGEGSEERLWRLEPGARAPVLAAVTDGAIASARRPDRCALGSDFAVCAEASAVSPPRLVRIDLASGETRLLADPNSDLRARIHARATPLRWTDKHGAGFSGLLLRNPAASNHAPLVIQYYHCDGFLKGGVGDELPMIPLVEAGISVLCIRKARPPEGPTDREYDLALSGIAAAIDKLAAAGTVDPRTVGIGGLSFGSQVALWAIRKSRLFAAATLSSGQFEPSLYWAYALPGSGVPTVLKDYWGLGDPDVDREGWQRISAVSDIDAIDTPVLMQLPESEARLVTEFHAKLKRAGKAADLFVFADEPHIKTQPIHQYSANQRNLDWYKFWLLGLEHAEPAKAAQYARWRGYRAGQSLPAPAP